MKMLDEARACVAGMLLSVCALAAAERPFRPANGITPIDLLGDGTRAMMVVGKRENFNAHSFELASLYVRVGQEWNVVTYFDDDVEFEQLTSSGGADCLLHDFRFRRASIHKPLELVIADREFGDTFSDSRPVVFRIYSLRHNVDKLWGRPDWYFELYATRTSRESYCDVGDAFTQASEFTK